VVSAKTIGYVGLGAAALGAGVFGLTKLAKSRRSTKSKKRKKVSTRSGKKRRYYPHTAGKRKDTSHKRIRRTKNGAYYVILASGKARFISKKSALASKRRKGGRY
jgi:hypothetical protein